MNSTYIWEITSKQDGLLFPEIEKEGESLLEEKWGESLLDQWKSFKLKFLDDYGTQQADFYFILGFIPVASESICSLFDFKESDVELLPVYDDAGTKFYVINPCYCDSRILNRRKSKIKYNDDGGVFWVSDPVFYTRPSKPLFKIPEMSTKAYVDNSFVSVVKKHNLQGIDFVPCKIKEESVIDKILKSIHCLFLFSLIGALVASCAGSREEHQERKEHTDDTAAISDGFMSSSSSVELSEANKTSYEFVNSSSSKAIIEEIPSENSEKQVRKKNVKAANRIADVSALGEITISQEMPYFFDAFSQFVSSADFQTADIDNSLAGVFKQMLEEAYGGNANFYLEQKNAPQIDKELIEALMKEGRFEEAQNLRLKIVERYDSNSVWYKKNQKYPESVKNAEAAIRGAMLDIPQYHHAQAAKLTKEGDLESGKRQYAKAIESYEAFLKRYAKEPTWDEYKVHINLALVYHEMGQHANAAKMFNWIVETDTTRYGRRPMGSGALLTKDEAGYNAVLMMDQARENAKKTKANDDVIQAYSLPETKAYFDQVDKYMAKFGKNKEAAELAYNAAIVHYDAKQFKVAVNVLRKLKTDFPKHQYILLISRLLAQSLLESNQFDESLTEFEWLLKQYTKVKETRNDSMAKEIEKAIAYVLFQMAEQSVKAGQYEKGAEAYLALVKRYPLIDIADIAVLESGVAYEKVNQYEKAIESFLLLQTKYACSPLALEGNHRAKEIYEKKGIISAKHLFKPYADLVEWQNKNCGIENERGEQFDNGTFIDSRDGQTYKTVRIGSQIWMAQNLNYKIGKSSCYNNSKKNCEKYGRLYDWNTAMKACPKGWHLPSSSEYEQLMITACGKKGCEKELNSNTDWVYSGNNNEDTLGFSALPAGYYGGHYLWTDGKKFRSRGWGANFWTSSTDENEALVLDISGGNEYVSCSSFLSSWNKDNQASIRCIKDINSENLSKGGAQSEGYTNAKSARSYGSYNSQRQHLKENQ